VARFLALLLAFVAACSPRPSARTLSITDDWGRTVALAAPARRIVSLSPSSTEILFALGLGPRVVGRTSYCDFPPAVRSVPEVGNGIEPNVEAVAARHPDLVVLYASAANRAADRGLAALGIPVAVLKLDVAADVVRAARRLAASPVSRARPTRWWTRSTPRCGRWRRGPRRAGSGSRGSTWTCGPTRP